MFRFKYIDLWMFMLINISGNPLITNFKYFDVLLCLYLILFFIRLQKRFFINRDLVLFVGSIVLLSFLQSYLFNFFSYVSYVGFLIKLLIGFLTWSLFVTSGYSFIESFIRNMMLISALSLPFYLYGYYFDHGILINYSTLSLIFYTDLINVVDSSLYRNCGLFWEPGAFAGYLLIALIFSVIKEGELKFNSNNIFLMFTLTTTFSTAGYVLLMALLILKLGGQLNITRIFGFIIANIFFILIFFKSEILFDKLIHQYNSAVELEEGTFSDTRFGSAIFDWLYIKSSPLLGNGLHSTTRFRFQSDFGEHGFFVSSNGLTNFIAIWGIPFFVLYLYSIYKNLKCKLNLLKTVGLLMLLLLIFSTENYLMSPFFLGFFFYRYN